jgi:hypothetical protein
MREIFRRQRLFESLSIVVLLALTIVEGGSVRVEYHRHQKAKNPNK